MKLIDPRYIKQSVTAIVVLGILTRVLFTSADFTSKLIVLPFFLFSLALLLRNVFLLLGKRSLAAAFSKICAIVFAVYWFGFLLYWDYICIVNRDYMSVLFSLLPWFGGGYIIYRRLKRKEK